MPSILVVVWLIAGPLFGFSDTWQLVANTLTNWFLMVFLSQNTQNRNGTATQAKLDALIKDSGASEHFVGIEHLPQREVEKFRAKGERVP